MTCWGCKEWWGGMGWWVWWEPSRRCLWETGEQWKDHCGSLREPQGFPYSNFRLVCLTSAHWPFWLGGWPSERAVEPQRAGGGTEKRPAGAAQDHPGGQPGRLGGALQDHPAPAAGDTRGQRREKLSLFFPCPLSMTWFGSALLCVLCVLFTSKHVSVIFQAPVRKEMFLSDTGPILAYMQVFFRWLAL